MCVSPSAFSQDSDGDGAADTGDAYPCDASIAAVSYAPALDTFAMLLAEDQWPRRGDEDTNDVVLAHNFIYRLNAQGQVVSLRASFDVLALGGSLDNGLGLHLNIPAASVSRIYRQLPGGMPQDLVMESDAELTVRVSDNLREFFGGQAGQINSLATAPRVASAAVMVEVELSTPAAVPTADMFIFRSGDFGYQIHRPEFSGTAAMTTGRFGTHDDASSANRKFVDTRGVPFIFTIPQEVAYPAEGVALATLYPDLLTFGASGGTLAQDFYLSTVVATAAYKDDASQPQLVATTPAAEPAPDTSCLPTSPGTDGGSSAYLDRIYQTARWSLNNGTAYTEYVLRGEGWTPAGDHYDDTYEIVLFDQTGADISTGQHGNTFQCTFVTDGSCYGACSAVPGHLFDGAFSWYGPHYSHWWELSCTFNNPVILRSIQNSAYSAAYGEGPRTLFGRRADGKLINVPVDGDISCHGCTPTDIALPWGQSNTNWLTTSAQP